MKPYQYEFIQFALDSGVLKFGDFTLKSGRLSPYFFNAGMFSDGNAFYKLASFYSDAIYENFQGQHDVLFGPAYKGISLATSASIGLMIKYNQNMPVTFNRKEAKDHGEGGTVIGSTLTGKRVLLIDDVITAGTTIRESFNTINAQNGKLIGTIIALDRQEKGAHSELSAIQEVANEFNLKISSIISLDNLVEYLENSSFPNSQKHLQKISAYRALYGANYKS